MDKYKEKRGIVLSTLGVFSAPRKRASGDLRLNAYPHINRLHISIYILYIYIFDIYIYIQEPGPGSLW